MPESAAPAVAPPSRRDALLSIAAAQFAQRGFKNTTVRDIADAAGILSGSLYHHFESKEQMADEILDSFQTELFQTLEEILASDLGPRAKVIATIRTSFDAIDQHHSAVALYQNDAAFLMETERFAYLRDRLARFRSLWMELLAESADAGVIRTDLDLEVLYRFLRDTIWVAVGWYRPGGPLTIEEVTDQYLAIVMNGIATDNQGDDHV